LETFKQFAMEDYHAKMKLMQYFAKNIYLLTY